MNELPYLPHELIIQILLRLPVKSLIRFKCVCKSWFSIIFDSHFANSQFQLAAATHTHRALLINKKDPAETRSVDLEASLEDDTAFVSLNPNNFMDLDPFGYVEIKGSCRGFILLLRYSCLYLWNPCSGIHKKIPLSPISRSLYRYFIHYFYGVGYDQSTDDYLVVLMSNRSKYSSYLEIFSLRANKWKQIDRGTDIHYWYYYTQGDRKAGSFFNGAIHWTARCFGIGEDVIVAFDLIERKLFDMHLPNDFRFPLDSYDLWVFQEFLSLWGMNKDTVEIWVMKEYNVRSSWTKTHVLPVDAIPTKKFSPLCSTKSSDIVGTDDRTGLVKYNDEGQLLEHRSYGNSPYRFQVAVYTESLFSLAVKKTKKKKKKLKKMAQT